MLDNKKVVQKNKTKYVYNVNKKVNFQAYPELSLNKKIIIERSISEVKARILFDSEADLTCFRKSFLYRTKNSQIKLYEESVQGFSSHKVEIFEKIKVKVEIERQKEEIERRIFERLNYDIILEMN